MLSKSKRRYNDSSRYLYWWRDEHSDKQVMKEHKHDANRYDRRKDKQLLSKLFKII